MEETALRSTELRVLGVLIEKSLSQPAYYPMTVNAITAACNQKTNREPVTDYSEGDVSHAISSLRHKQWVAQAEPERNSRSIKFRHCVEDRTDWNAAQRALMAELMLRGPQTLGELRNRASRMTHLESQDYARELLRELESCDPPLVVEMEREPGKSARRFTQLLGGAIETPAPAVTHAASDATPTADGAPRVFESSTLAERVARLETAVAELQAEIAELRRAGGGG